MIDFLPPVLMGEVRQQQQVVLRWDTRTIQLCTPLVTGVVWEGGWRGGNEGCIYVLQKLPSQISTSLTYLKTIMEDLVM